MVASTAARGETIRVTTSAAGGGDTAGPAAALKAAAAKGLPAGTVVEVDDRGGPLVEDLSLPNLRGEPASPIVIRGAGRSRAVIRGRLRLTGAAYVVLHRLAFEPEAADAGEPAPWLNVEGRGVEIRDCSITGALPATACAWPARKT